MPEVVDCSECGTPYDSQEHPFCPRCGSTVQKATVPGALASARRNDPSRRRVQASGAVLAAVGGLFFVLMAAMLALTPSLAEATLDLLHTGTDLQAPAGGNLSIEVVRDGAPLAGVPITLRHGNGTTFAEGATDSSGTYRASLGAASTATVDVQVDNQTFTRNATAPAGTTTTVRIDVAKDPATAEGWVGAATWVKAIRIFLVVALVVCALLVAAGISALRLRAWGFALSAGLVGLLPFLVLFVATLQLGFLLVLLVIAIPVGLIARGRRHFQTA